MGWIIKGVNSEDPLTCATSRTAALAFGQFAMVLAFAFINWDFSEIADQKAFIRAVIAGDVFYFGLIYACMKANVSLDATTKHSIE